MWTEEEYITLGIAGWGQEIFLECMLLCERYKAKKILLMDYSREGSLRSVLPIPKELTRCEGVVISCGDYDYIWCKGGEDFEDYGFEYDLLIAHFGAEILHDKITSCNQRILFTDMKQHHLNAIKDISKTENMYIVIAPYFYGVQSTKILPEQIQCNAEQLYVLPYSENEQVVWLAGIPLSKVTKRSFSRETRQLAEDIWKKICGISLEQKDTDFFHEKKISRWKKLFWREESSEKVWS